MRDGDDDPESEQPSPSHTQARVRVSSPSFPPRFTKYLLATHQTALTSQLLSTLAITTACLIRRESPTLQAYESVTIQAVVVIVLLPSLMTLASSPRKFSHFYTSLACLLITISLALYTLWSTPKAQREHWRVRGSCLDYFDQWDFTSFRLPIWGVLFVLIAGILIGWGILVGIAEEGWWWWWEERRGWVGQVLPELPHAGHLGSSGRRETRPRRCGCYYCGNKAVRFPSGTSKTTKNPK